MIEFFAEAGIILLATIWYWFDTDRRRYLRKRVGRMAFRNVYHVARNMHYMIFRRAVRICYHRPLPEQGSILYSWHFGVWELMPGALANRDNRLGIVVNRYEGSRFARLLDRFLVNWRSTGNVQIFSTNDAAKIIGFLRSRGILGVLVDGNKPYSRYETVQRLSRIARVPMIPFAAYRDRGDACLEIGCDLEELIERRPMDYMWFYRSRAAA